MPTLSQRKPDVQLHPRLVRLDEEMMPRGVKPHAYLYASHEGHHWLICCMRLQTFRYTATTSTGHKTKSLALRAHGKTPSEAVRELLRQLKWNLQQKPEVFAKMFPKMEVSK